jgi:RNA polymerase sigma factor (sigma-70 family)
MSELDLLADRFEQDRPHLRAVAQRILGSTHEADDAVQEAWMRLSRSDTAGVGNLTGWLTTVVSRVCLDMLRSRSARREDPAELPPVVADETADPEGDAVMADAIGPALLLVLDTLGPGERLAFVLHDMFAVPFPQIADIVGCTPAAARQLASRARRRVQGIAASDERHRDDELADEQPRDAVPGGAGSGGSDAGSGGAGSGGERAGRVAAGGHGVARRRAVVDAFLAASRDGDFAALLALLDPDVVVRADAAAAEMGSDAVISGARAVAEAYNGRARAALPALLDGEPGLVWSLRGTPQVAFAFTIAGDLILEIELLANPATLAAMSIETGPASRRD